MTGISGVAQNTEGKVVALAPPKGLIPVVARPHPFSTDAVCAMVPVGESIAEIIGAEARNCRVEIAGMVIPPELWASIRPNEGMAIAITRYPEGGGGAKTIFRIVAFAALAVAMVLVPGMQVFAGWSALAKAGLAAGIGIGGMLVINALIPPASIGVSASTSSLSLKGISGTENTTDPYGAIPCVLGTMRVYPKLAANSYTELSGDNQYLRCLFDFGYGTHDYAAMQIGTNDLANYAGGGLDYEIGTNPGLFSQDIEEVSNADELDDDGDVATRTTGTNANEASIDLVWSSGLFAVDSKGKTKTCTCKLQVQYQRVDSTASSGAGPVSAIPMVAQGTYWEKVSASVAITGDGSGATATATVEKIGTCGSTDLYGVTGITVTNGGKGYTYANAVLTVSGSTSADDNAAVIGAPQITLTGGTWSNALTASGIDISNSSADIENGYLVVRSSAEKSLRVGIRWKFPSCGEYNVMVSRISTDYQGADANSRQGGMTWTTVRTIRNSNASTTGTTKLAMRIKATDQLNSTISQFNLLLSQVIPAWNGTAWVNQQTSNPAWIYRWLLRDSAANPRHVDADRIDDETLKEWGAECDANGFTFDYTVDSSTTLFELLKLVCACGRASFTVKDGKYSVVRDIAQTTPVQVFTPRNTNNFSGNRVFSDVVHAFRVQFINPEADYQQDEVVVYDDGYDSTNATKFETLQIPGCANAEMAWKLGRYHLAVARLRPNTYTWTTDVEHLVCNRGDLVEFANDVIDTGIGWGRIKGVTLDANGNATAVTVDNPVDIADATKTYSLRIRCQDGKARVSAVTFAGTGNIAQFALTTPLASINPDDLFVFGLQGQDVLSLLITKIEPSEDLAAKITAVDAAPAVLTADAGYTDSVGTYHSGVPTLTSSITGQAWLDAPPAPQMVICRTAPNIATFDSAGNKTMDMLVTVI